MQTYKGARYVPKFFYSPNPPGSYEWFSGTSYEPLTIVSYQGRVYTSRQLIPAGSAAPVAGGNADWADCGLINEVSLDDIQRLQQAINANVSAIDQERSERVVQDGILADKILAVEMKNDTQDNLITDLQTNINALENKEETDVNNLQTNINATMAAISETRQMMTTNDDALRRDLQTETNARTSMDEQLLGEIGTAEQQSRAAVEVAQAAEAGVAKINADVESGKIASNPLLSSNVKAYIFCDNYIDRVALQNAINPLFTQLNSVIVFDTPNSTNLLIDNTSKSWNAYLSASKTDYTSATHVLLIGGVTDYGNFTSVTGSMITTLRDNIRARMPKAQILSMFSFPIVSGYNVSQAYAGARLYEENMIQNGIPFIANFKYLLQDTIMYDSGVLNGYGYAAIRNGIYNALLSNSFNVRYAPISVNYTRLSNSNLNPDATASCLMELVNSRIYLRNFRFSMQVVNQTNNFEQIYTSSRNFLGYGYAYMLSSSQQYNNSNISFAIDIALHKDGIFINTYNLPIGYYLFNLEGTPFRLV